MASTEETDPYLEVARRFFNEFLELKVSLDREGAVPAKTQEKERAKYEKELKKWQDANKVLKDTAQALVADNERLEEEVARLEVERDNIRRELNEALIRQSDVARKLHDYPLAEHIRTQEAWDEWQKVLKFISEKPTRR
jgi:multidrug resistance efflux pump